MKLGGGWGNLLHDQVPPLILLEIQKYAQMRLEKKWMPLFLRSEELGPQKKMKVTFLHSHPPVFFVFCGGMFWGPEVLMTEWLNSSKLKRVIEK